MPVTGIAVVSWVIQLVGQSVPSLGIIQKTSPFCWAEPSRVLIHGFDWVQSGSILIVMGIILWLALRSLERRDVVTASREWHIRLLPRLRHRRTGPPSATESKNPRAQHA